MKDNEHSLFADHLINMTILIRSPEICTREIQKMRSRNAKNVLMKCKGMRSRNAKTALENAKTALDNAKNALRYHFLHWSLQNAMSSDWSWKFSNFLNNEDYLLPQQKNKAENVGYNVTM